MSAAPELPPTGATERDPVLVTLTVVGAPAPRLPGPAGCAGHPSPGFLADVRDYHRGDVALDVHEAKRVCATECATLVRLACLRHALAYGESHGIWGGLDPYERRALAARIARAEQDKHDQQQGDAADGVAHAG